MYLKNVLNISSISVSFFCILISELGIQTVSAEPPSSEITVLYECYSDNQENGIKSEMKEVSTIRVDDPGLRDEFHSNISQYLYKYEKSSKPLGCKNGNTIERVPLPVRLEKDAGAKQYVILSDVTFAVRKVSLLPTGQLHRRHENVSIFYRPHEYCIRRLNSSHTEFEMCTSHCVNSVVNANAGPVDTTNAGEEREICIQKCCPPGSTISFHFQQTIQALKSTGQADNSEFQIDAVRTAPETPTCQPSGEKRWKPTFYDAKRLKSSNSLEVIAIEEEPRYKIVWNRNHQECNDTRFHSRTKLLYGDDILESYSWHLLSNGSVILNPLDNSSKDGVGTRDRKTLKSGNSEKWKVLNQPFCIDGIHDFADETKSGTGTEYAGHQEQVHQLLHVCYDHFLSKKTGNRTTSSSKM